MAGYTLQTRGRPARTVTVTIAGDGSWLVTIPGGALGGGADVAVAATPGGLFECTVGAPTNCYRVGSAEAALPARSDPRVHHVFTDWLQVFSNRDAAISDETWSRLSARYDEQQLIELCMLIGHYHMVAFALNSLRVQREEGVPGLGEP